MSVLRKNRSLQITIGALALVVLVAGGFFVHTAILSSDHASGAMDTLALQEADQLSGKMTASLSGLPAGTDIRFSVAAPGAPALTGVKKVAPDGSLVLPEYAAAAKSNPVIYDLEIQPGSEKEHAPVRLRMALDTVSALLRVSGDGFAPFTEVTWSDDTEARSSKADWAGVLKEAGLLRDESGQAKSVQLAMGYGGQVYSDANNFSPFLISVGYTGGGGGGPGSGSVNSSSCDDSDLSICKGGQFNSMAQLLRANFIAMFQMATAQMSSVAMQQTAIIGSFFEAKHQLETQRTLQTLAARAHKDYHPSEQMCRVGSYVRSVAASELRSAHEKQAINAAMMNYYTNHEGSSGSEGAITDSEARLDQFRKNYCNLQDNNNGLVYICDHDQDTSGGPSGAPKTPAGRARMNKDIDYIAGFAMPLTLGTNFENNARTPQEQAANEDILALARNLYWVEVFEPGLQSELPAKYADYMKARHVMAMKNVAHTSFAHIAGMKSNGSTALGDQSGQAHMKSFLREMGLPDTEIDDLLGLDPSYYAQMEVLTKKMLQSPDFYTNLYDKPVNVERIGVALDAIKLMNARDHYESNLRREMLFSLMVEDSLDKHFQDVNSRMESLSVLKR